MEVGTQFCLICRMSGKYHFENRTARLTDGLECVENSLCSISLIIVVVSSRVHLNLSWHGNSFLFLLSWLPVFSLGH